MEDVTKQLAVSAPNLLCLLAVVAFFLKYMSKRDELIRALTEEHLAERKLQRDVIERNSLAAATNTIALNNVAYILTERTKEVFVMKEKL